MTTDTLSPQLVEPPSKLETLTTSGEQVWYQKPGDELGNYTLKRKLRVTSTQADLWEAIGKDTLPVIIKIYRYGLQIKSLTTPLNHPHLLTPLATGTYEGHYYEVMPYLSYGTINDHKLSNDQLLSVGQQLLSALSYLRSLQLSHGDIKPENILVLSLEPLHVVLSDFGSLCTLGQTTLTQPVGATLTYAAPETFAGTYSPASDLWSLGMTLWTLLIGENPFAKLNTRQQLYTYAAGNFQRPQGDHPIYKLIGLLLTADYTLRLSVVTNGTLGDALVESPVAAKDRREILDYLHKHEYGSMDQLLKLYNSLNTHLNKWYGFMSLGVIMAYIGLVTLPFFRNIPFLILFNLLYAFAVLAAGKRRSVMYSLAKVFDKSEPLEGPLVAMWVNVVISLSCYASIEGQSLLAIWCAAIGTTATWITYLIKPSLFPKWFRNFISYPGKYVPTLLPEEVEWYRLEYGYKEDDLDTIAFLLAHPHMQVIPSNEPNTIKLEVAPRVTTFMGCQVAKGKAVSYTIGVNQLVRLIPIPQWKIFEKSYPHLIPFTQSLEEYITKNK